MRVIISSLQLQSRLEYFSRHVQRARSQIGEKASGQVGKRGREAGVQEEAFGVLVGAEEDEGAAEGADEGGRDAAVEAAADAFLS